MGEVEVNRQSTADFQGSQTILLVVDACYKIFQMHRMYKTKSEP